jgi:hypothetical protein
MIWLLPHPLPRPAAHRKTETGRKLAKGGGGAKAYNHEKVWSSINHSIFSGRYRKYM